METVVASPVAGKVVRGGQTFEGRPGASLEPLDFDGLRKELREQHGPHIREVDVISASLYPKVWQEYRTFRDQFANVGVLPTRAFLAPMEIGEEISVEIERGKTLVIEFEALGELDDDGNRMVYFQLNGRPRSIRVPDESVTNEVVVRTRADPNDPGSVGAPLPGVVLVVRTESGATVEVGDPLVVLSAMKMETVVASPVAGKVVRLEVAEGDSLAAGDLLVQIETT
jgi:pyruvate carboxylase